jgi:hypothetical protein
MKGTFNQGLLLSWLWSTVPTVYRRERPGGDTAESDKAWY